MEGGTVAERPNAPALKADVPRGTESSNLSRSALYGAEAPSSQAGDSAAERRVGRGVAFEHHRVMPRNDRSVASGEFP